MALQPHYLLADVVVMHSCPVREHADCTMHPRPYVPPCGRWLRYGCVGIEHNCLWPTKQEALCPTSHGVRPTMCPSSCCQSALGSTQPALFPFLSCFPCITLLLTIDTQADLDVVMLNGACCGMDPHYGQPECGSVVNLVIQMHGHVRCRLSTSCSSSSSGGGGPICSLMTANHASPAASNGLPVCHWMRGALHILAVVVTCTLHAPMCREHLHKRIWRECQRSARSLFTAPMPLFTTLYLF